MKVAVTAQDRTLDSLVDPRFGRARYFLLIDTETGNFTVHDNLQNLNAPGALASRRPRRLCSWGRRRC